MLYPLFDKKNVKEFYNFLFETHPELTSDFISPDDAFEHIKKRNWEFLLNFPIEDEKDVIFVTCLKKWLFNKKLYNELL